MSSLQAAHSKFVVSLCRLIVDRLLHIEQQPRQILGRVRMWRQQFAGAHPFSGMWVPQRAQSSDLPPYFAVGFVDIRDENHRNQTLPALHAIGNRFFITPAPRVFYLSQQVRSLLTLLCRSLS